MSEPQNSDELFALMEADELRDREELASHGVLKMTPREYAKSKGLQPQLVYYYIRQGDIKTVFCDCGRKVIDVAGANAFFDERARKKSGQPVLPEEA